MSALGECDLEGCPTCVGPALNAQETMLLYRIGTRYGAIGPQIFGRLADAVEQAIFIGQDAEIFRVLRNGDLQLMARCGGRRERT